MSKPVVFLSYSHRDRSVADTIDADLQAIGVSIQRDTREIGYRGSIKDFMRGIRCTDYVLLLVSAHYLKSQNCLFEVLEILKEPNFSERILPVRASNGLPFTVFERAEYVHYWQSQLTAAKRKVGGLSPENLGSIPLDLKHIANIAQNIEEILQLLGDMHMMDLSELSGRNYRDLLDTIGFEEPALAEQLIRIRKLPDEEEQDLAMETFLLSHPSHALGYTHRGWMEMTRKKYRKALATLEHAVALDPDLGYAQTTLAICLCILQKYDDSILHHDKAIELEPKNAIYYNSRGYCYSNMKDSQAAIRDFDMAIGLNPESYLAHVNRAYEYGILGDYDRCIADCTRSIELCPDEPTPYGNRAASHAKLGHYGDAVLDWSKAIALSPEARFLYEKRARDLTKLNRVDEAIADYDIAIRLAEMESEDLYPGTQHPYRSVDAGKTGSLLVVDFRSNSTLEELKGRRSELQNQQ